MIKKVSFISSKVEYYQGIQNGTKNKFILKRLKLNTVSTEPKSIKTNFLFQDQQLFDELTNQTLILKQLEQKFIPKCLRILKTSNSIYYVFEHYPLRSIQTNVFGNFSSLEQKISLSVKIISTILYIHSKNVAYNAISWENIHIDKQGNLYFTNFKNAVHFKILQMGQSSVELMRKKKQFLLLVKQDILQVGKIKFAKNGQKLTTVIEKKLYGLLSQIISKKFTHNILDTILNILNENQNIRTTACTDQPESPRSPSLRNSKFKMMHMRSNTSIQKNLSSVKNLQSKLSLRLEQKPSLSLVNLLNIPSIHKKQTSGILNTPHSRLSSSNKLQSLKLLQRPLTQRSTLQSMKSNKSIKVQKQEMKSLKINFGQILKNRKLLEFLLNLLSFININKNSHLFLLFLIKCERLLTNMKEKLTVVKNQRFILRRQKDFITIIENQAIKNTEFLNFLKQQSLKFVNLDQKYQIKQIKSMEQYCIEKNLSKIEDSLSLEIYKFINPEIKQMPLNYQNLFEKCKWLYFLTINLKYKSFEKFYDKKFDNQSKKISIFEEEYFTAFQNQSVSLKLIINQVKERLERYSKKYYPSECSIK